MNSGKRLPIVGKRGGRFARRSALVYYGLSLDVVVESTTKFYKSTNILYLYICCIIVGSIMSMNRTVLIRGFLRIFFPMLCGEIVGHDVGMGWAGAGLEPFQIFSLSFCRSWRAAWVKGDPAVDRLCDVAAYGSGRGAGDASCRW